MYSYRLVVERDSAFVHKPAGVSFWGGSRVFVAQTDGFPLTPVGSPVTRFAGWQPDLPYHEDLATARVEQERAAGAWQAEAETLAELLRLTGEGVAAIRRCLERLEVYPGRMRENLDLTDGLVMSESLASALGAKLGRARAQELVGEAVRKAGGEDSSLATAAAASPEIAGALGADGIAAALDPAAYLGQAEEIVDRAIAAHHRRPTGGPA